MHIHNIVVCRFFGVADGRMEQQQELEKIWSNCFLTCLVGTAQRRTWVLQVCNILPFCEVALRVNNNLAGREEHITEAVMFWNNRKIDVLPQYLTQRLQKVMWHVCVVCNHLFLVYSDRSGWDCRKKRANCLLYRKILKKTWMRRHWGDSSRTCRISHFVSN